MAYEVLFDNPEQIADWIKINPINMPFTIYPKLYESVKKALKADKKRRYLFSRDENYCIICRLS